MGHFKLGIGFEFSVGHIKYGKKVEVTLLSTISDLTNMVQNLDKTLAFV
jgi:hypothetical protein